MILKDIPIICGYRRTAADRYGLLYIFVLVTSCFYEVYGRVWTGKKLVAVLLLDGKNRIIRRVQISQGSLNQSIVHPREVFNPAVKESAAAMILLHNHPTGDPNPSSEDIAITRRLKEAGELMGIKVLDHIIIGDEEYLSFVERGLL